MKTVDLRTSNYPLHDNQTSQVPGPLSRERIDAACASIDAHFVCWGCPEDWDRRDCFRAGSHTFPSYGITIAVEEVLKWEQRVMEEASCGAGI